MVSLILSQYAISNLLALRENDRADVNVFSDLKFSAFKCTLNAKMKELQKSGKYMPKKAQPITIEHEDISWEKRLLGDHSPQPLIDTLVFYVGMCFVLRSGEKHQRLRYHPAQIELVEPVGGISYLMYHEDVSRTNQGRIQHRKVENKEVVHHVNEGNPERCLVQLYKLYQSCCPPGRPNEAFYLKPLKKPKADVLFGCSHLGHNLLGNTIRRLFERAEIPRFHTNHSLRTTAATRLFDAGVDEQLITKKNWSSECSWCTLL